MHISFETEFRASFFCCCIPLEGLERGSAEPCTSAVTQRQRGRKADGRVCWLWKAVALAEVSELRQGFPAYVV